MRKSVWIYPGLSSKQLSHEMNVLKIDLIYQEFTSYILPIDFLEFLLLTGLGCVSVQILPPSILMTSFIHYL